MDRQNHENQQISLLIQEIADVKKLLQEIKNNPPIAQNWIPRSKVMEFLEYKDTQMGALEPRLVISKVGNRKFIHRDSIISLLENSIVK